MNNQEFSTRVEHLYRVFQRYPAGTLSDNDSQEEQAYAPSLATTIQVRLGSKPLRLLTDGDLLDFYYLAVTHIGGVDDFKHYLPRLLEIMVSEGTSLLSPKALPSILADADFGSWPAQERLAVLKFLRGTNSTRTLQQIATKISEMVVEC